MKMTDSWRQFGSDGNGNSNYGREAVGSFSLKYQIIDKILAVRSEGLFWASNKVGCSFGFGLRLWRLHTITVQVERPWEFLAKGLDFGLGLWRLHTVPSQRLQLLYCIGYVISTHFFGLSTKFGHSIPRALDLDGQSVKWPLESYLGHPPCQPVDARCHLHRLYCHVDTQ
jgi:hypothetical protein